VIDDFFALDHWAVNFTACDSTLIYRRLHAHTDMNILLSGTYDNRTVATMEIFGLFSFTSIITASHVFDPSKWMHTVYGFYHPECVSGLLVDGNIPMGWTAQEPRKKALTGKSTLGEVMLVSAKEVIKDLSKVSKRNILVFMPSKKLGHDLQREFHTEDEHQLGVIIWRSHVVLKIDQVHGSDADLCQAIDEYFPSSGDLATRVMVIKGFRSILSEGIDFPDGTVSAILICRLPWTNPNSSEISTRESFLKTYLTENDSTTVNRML
jgi:hypothetical protein